MSLFVDTSAFYALLVKSEADHSAVRRAFAQAAESGRRMVTTSYVVVESSALLQHRIGLAPVRDLTDRVLPLVETVYVDERRHQRGVDRLFRMDRRNVSLVDAVSFETMEDEGISEVLGLDPDFEAEGFRLLPPRPRRSSS